jgi:hypothetical protein
MTPDRLFSLAAEFAEASANAARTRGLLPSAQSDTDLADLHRQAARWDETAAHRREALREALRTALGGAVRAVPDEELPVATWHSGRVEVRAIADDGGRAVRVRYTPAQALAAGAALIACAAITDAETGGTLTTILAAFPPNPRPEATTTAGDMPEPGSRA